VRNPQKFFDIKEEVSNKDLKLKLKKIDDDDLIFVDNIDRRRDQKGDRVIPDKYVFSPYSLLGRYLYFNVESTRLLFLAR